jgi:outer membrane beta-barrel protein
LHDRKIVNLDGDLSLKVWFLILALLLSSVVVDTSGYSKDEERFSGYEIRVIRPKYFTKRNRFELGAEFLLVMNDTFVYTLMASGILTYHFSESLALEMSIALGQSINRSEKDILFDEFDIRTEVFRTLYFAELALLYTPVYGKLQLPEGRLIYFDTFGALGAGLTGVEWKYSDFCQDPSGDQAEIPSDTTNTYPNLVYGLGQRIYYTKSSALRWDLRGHTVFFDRGDASCDPENTASAADTHTNITIQVGASKFF